MLVPVSWATQEATLKVNPGRANPFTRSLLDSFSFILSLPDNTLLNSKFVQFRIWTKIQTLNKFRKWINFKIEQISKLNKFQIWKNFESAQIFFLKFEQVTHMNKKWIWTFFCIWTKSWVQKKFVYEQILKFEKSLNQKTI
jgi:hypothetical protein